MILSLEMENLNNIQEAELEEMQRKMQEKSENLTKLESLIEDKNAALKLLQDECAALRKRLSKILDEDS